MLIWKSVPLRRSQSPSRKLNEHWTRQNKTLRRLLVEIPLEFEAFTSAAELNSTRDRRQRSRRQDCQRQVGAETTQGTIRTVRLRGRCEGRRRLRQHDDDSTSENATLASNRPPKRRLHSVHNRREIRLPQSTHEGR